MAALIEKGWILNDLRRFQLKKRLASMPGAPLHHSRTRGGFAVRKPACRAWSHSSSLSETCGPTRPGTLMGVYALVKERTGGERGAELRLVLPHPQRLRCPPRRLQARSVARHRSRWDRAPARGSGAGRGLRAGREGTPAA